VVSLTLSVMYAAGLNLLLLLAALGAGAPAIVRFGMKREETGAFLLFAIPIGLGILSLITLALGALGFYYAWVAWVLLGILALCGLVELILHRAVYEAGVRRSLPSLRQRPLIWTAALLALLSLNLLYPLIAYGLIPPVTYDEVAYHMAIPKIFIQHHGITYIPFIPYSNWPLGTEMLYTLSLLLHSETLAHLVTWDSLLLICVGLWWFARRYVDEQEGLLAAVLFAATPMVGALAGTALIELPLALFSFLAVVALIVWTEKEQTSWWVLSAICGGFAASIKLNGAVVPLILGVFLLFYRMLVTPSQWRNAIKQFAAYGAIALAVVLPWYLKTWILAGNPVWPFFLKLLGGKDWDALGSEYLFGFIKLVNLPITLPNWFTGLPRLVLQPRPFAPPGVDLIWYYLVLPLLVIPALIFSRGMRRRVLAWLCVIALGLYTAWFLETHQARFLLLVTPVLSLLMAAGVGWLMRGRGRPIELLMRSALVLGLIGTGWPFNQDSQALLRTRWPVLVGVQDREDFLSANVSGYTVYRYANDALPKNSRVWLALYESRGYYLDRDYMWANPISQRHIRLERYAGADQLYADLKAMGFTYMLFAPKKLDRYEYIRYGPQLTQLVLELRAKHCDVQFETSDLVLCELE
jgi:hypothetical protein